jgi:4'-phosphopantetheinyl transferase
VTTEDSATEVHLWRCSLDLPLASLDEEYAVLASDEIERARRYKFTRDRRRFVAARSFLRRTLAEYLSVSPLEISFVYGAFGKPGLSRRPDGARVEFNMSHSADLAILAISRGPEVGVDVEQVIQVPELQGTASRFFSAYENAALNEVPAENRNFAFYCCWTRKEAFLKALGHGLAHSLDSFDVSLDEERPKLVAVRSDRGAPSEWTLFHLCPAPGYVAALAVKGNGVRVVWRSGMSWGLGWPLAKAGEVDGDDTSEGKKNNVVVNREQQYSGWPIASENPGDGRLRPAPIFCAPTMAYGCWKDRVGLGSSIRAILLHFFLEMPDEHGDACREGYGP